MDILYALHRIDLRLFHRIFQQGERGILRPLARALSHSADGYLMLLVPLLLFLLGAERAETFTILLLVIAVAAFNIVSTLVMVVTDKRSEIAILRIQQSHARQAGQTEAVDRIEVAIQRILNPPVPEPSAEARAASAARRTGGGQDD